MQLVGVVDELTVDAVKDKPSSPPRLDTTSHLDEEPCGTVWRDGEVGGTAVNEVTGLLDETQQVEWFTAHWEVPRQRPRLHRLHQRHGSRAYLCELLLTSRGKRNISRWRKTKLSHTVQYNAQLPITVLMGRP